MLTKHSRHDWLLFMVILSIGVWAKMSHLERVGIRTADEGSYCFFGLTMLNGEPECIQDKPGQAAILAIGFTLFGPTQYGAVAITAILGVLTIPALYWLGLAMRSRLCAVALAASGACMPYLLYYHRGASSDSNYFLFCVLGLAAFLTAVQRAEGKESTAHDATWLSPKLLFLSGIFWGVGITVNLASIPPFGMAWLFLALLCRWTHTPPKRALAMLALFVGAGLVGVAAVELPLLKYINIGRVWGQVGGHSRHILQTTLRFEWAEHLWMFWGPLGLLFALIGLGNFKKWWKTPRTVFPIMSVALIVFYMRGQLQLPRLHVPILIPLMPLMAMGVESVVDYVNQRWKTLPEIGAQVFVALLLMGVHLPEVIRIQKLESGYPAACAWLSENMSEGDMGVGTHTFWTFASFTAQPFAPDENRLTGALNGDDWEKAFEAQLADYAFTHNRKWLVIDYLIFNRLYDPYDTKEKLAGYERLRSVLNTHPPESSGGVTIPNPVASDFQTHREDELVPDLRNEPMATKIYIYRIPDLVERLRGAAQTRE